MVLIEEGASVRAGERVAGADRDASLLAPISRVSLDGCADARFQRWIDQYKREREIDHAHTHTHTRTRVP